MTAATVIQKELVSDLHFYPGLEVLGPIERRKVLSDLYKAMFLGNVFQQKVRLCFICKEGYYCVETTVWFTSKEHILIKYDTAIPVDAIVSCQTL